jgi:hypothetical protein
MANYQQPNQWEAGGDPVWRSQYQPQQPYDAPPPRKKRTARRYLLGFLAATIGFLVVHAVLPKPTLTPTVVLTALGSGTKNTASFYTGSDWSITYSFACAGSGGQDNFGVTVYDSGWKSDTPINVRAAKGSNTAYEHGNWGTHHLSVTTECSWTLKVIAQPA